MAKDFNNITLIGRLTKYVELKTLSSGTTVASLSIANNNQYTAGNEKKETVSFFDATAFGKQADIMAQYLSKGSKVLISGRLNQRRWENKEGKNQSAVEIVVENFQFLDSKPSTTTVIGQEVPVSDVGSVHFSDEGMPF